MSLSRAEIEVLVGSLADRLRSGAIQKVFERDRDTIVMRIRAGGETFHLLVSMRPRFTRLHLVDAKPDQPPHPTAFTMQLRKWVEGARLEGLELVGDDRVVRFRLDVRDPEADEAPERLKISLVAELTGKNGCAYLLDSDDIILGKSHRYRGLSTGEPGDLWAAPPETDFESESVRWDLDSIAEPSPVISQKYEELEAEDDRTSALSDLRSRLKRESKRLKRRLKAVESDLAKAENAEEHKRRAELLQGAYGQEIPRGARSIKVTDYWDPDMGEVELELEPRWTLQENIDHAFHQYRRLSEATERIEARLLETMELSETTEEARASIEDDWTLEQVESARRRLEKDGVLPRKRAKRQQREEDRLPYRTYRASSGARILVGRNAKTNDVLTTKVARGRDVWLHARDWPGSHVVLRMNKGDEPRSDDLVDAAILAAHFSRGAQDSLIDVTWTYAKHVRKPKGAVAGLVTHSGGSNIAVRRDPERLKRLLATMEE